MKKRVLRTPPPAEKGCYKVAQSRQRRGFFVWSDFKVEIRISIDKLTINLLEGVQELLFELEWKS